MIPEGRCGGRCGADWVRVGTKWVRKQVHIKVGIRGWGGKNPDCLLVVAKWKYGGGE
jgi:hypothetical protein